jgi:hypothetical protein
MTFWEQVWTSVASAGTTVVLLGVVGKGIFDQVLARDLKTHEARLKEAGDSQIERIKSELSQVVESHKTRLKKSEFLFQKEFEAAGAFTVLFREYNPKLSRPDMEWDDACDQMASSFERTEAKLEAFLASHGAVLQRHDREALDEAIGIAGLGKFDVLQQEDGVRMDYDSATRADAQRLHESLKALNLNLIGRVHGQSDPAAIT